MISMRVITVISLTVLIASLACADTIYLKNGEVVEGEIVQETESAVTVKMKFKTSGFGVSDFRKTEIERIERGEVVASTNSGSSVVQNASPGGIDRTYDQVMWRLEEYFAMKEGTPVEGKKRYEGETKGGTALLELIGEKERIMKANLALAHMIDYQSKMQNDTILSIFCENTVPEWPECKEWAADIFRRRSEDAVVKGTKYIRAFYQMDARISIISVKANEAP